MARRGWGEGSVCRRTVHRNGKPYTYWRVVVSLGTDPSGRRLRKEKQARTERQARAWLKDVLGRGFPKGTGVTVGAYAVSWLRDTRGTVKPTTLDYYRSTLIHFEDISHLPIEALQPVHVRDLIAQKGHLSPRTVRGIVQTLALVLKRALGDGLVERNVAALVKLPRLEQKEPQHFTAEQARRFLDVARSDPHGGLYALALGTGLRRGELLGLQRQDVDLQTGTVAVRRGKTASATRLVPLPAFAQAALRADLGLVHDGVAHVGPIWQVSPSYVSKHFQTLCQRAGVPVLTFHSLRHSAASLLLDAGVDPFIIQQIIGHNRLSMLSHYARSGPELQREAMEKLGRMVG